MPLDVFNFTDILPENKKINNHFKFDLFQTPPILQIHFQHEFAISYDL